MVHVTGNNKPGRVTATITDLTVPAPGLPIQIQRTYDSLNSSISGDFGFGWNLGINVQVSISPEDDVTLTVNGSAKTFYFTPPPNSIFTYWYTPQYTPEPGLYGSLVTTGDNCDGVLNHIAQTGLRHQQRRQRLPAHRLSVHRSQRASLLAWTNGGDSIGEGSERQHADSDRDRHQQFQWTERSVCARLLGPHHPDHRRAGKSIHLRVRFERKSSQRDLPRRLNSRAVSATTRRIC